MEKSIYTGFHAVEERVRNASGKQSRNISLRIFYSNPGPRIKKILSQAKDVGIPCEQTDDRTLSSMTERLPPEARDHRGIILVAEGEEVRAKNSVLLEQWIKSCPENATVIMLDSVTDPHNVGAILRSADQFGADLVIMPDRRSASNINDNEIIARSSAGANAWVNVAVVTNLVRAAQTLRQEGFWIYGADAAGESLNGIKFGSRSCIIMGSEGNGIAKLLKVQCDSMISIPTCGKIDSLNVSVAAGVLLYERRRQAMMQLPHNPR